jgi:hypothetical protein
MVDQPSQRRVARRANWGIEMSAVIHADAETLAELSAKPRCHRGERHSSERARECET